MVFLPEKSDGFDRVRTAMVPEASMLTAEAAVEG
jgi:hypothetical protein